MLCPAHFIGAKQIANRIHAKKSTGMCRLCKYEMLPLSRHIWSQKYSKLVSIEACMVEWMKKLLQPVLLNFAIILKGLCDGRLPSDSALGRFSPKFYKSCDLAQSMILRTILRTSKLAWRYLMTENRHIVFGTGSFYCGPPYPGTRPANSLSYFEASHRIPYLEHGAAKHE